MGKAKATTATMAVVWTKDESYTFVSVEQLITDFGEDIERLRGGSHE